MPRKTSRPTWECAIWWDVNVLISGGDVTDRQTVARLASDDDKRLVPAVASQTVPDLESQEGRAELVRRSAGGTIFIEEVAALNGNVQAELMDMLEGRRAECRSPARRRPMRVIAAMSQNLLDRVGLNTFRGDLFYQLNAIHIVLGARRDPPKVWLM